MDNYPFGYCQTMIPPVPLSHQTNKLINEKKMDKLIASYKNYSIWQMSKNGLYDLAKFVVLENYKHHKDTFNGTTINHKEIREVHNEEILFFSQSKVFVAKNNTNEIAGTIRVMEWSGLEELPVTKLFGIRKLDEISPEDSNAPICKHKKGIMFAECDRKLFKTVNSLGIKAIALGEGIEYLGSLTIPMYATCSGMMDFFIHTIICIKYIV